MSARSGAALALAASLSLAACVSPRVPEPASAPSPAREVQPAPLPPLVTQPRKPTVPTGPAVPAKPAATAAATGVSSAAPLPALAADRAAAALRAFVASCPRLVAREDISGLTAPADWQAACAAAPTVADADAATFFATRFTPVTIGSGASFATGYYEPEIAGSRTPGPGYPVPIYRKPADLLEIDLGSFSPDLKGKRIQGRWTGSAFVPYAGRAAIEGGSLSGQGLELAYAADPVEFFFLQVQGSGRLRLPDGSVMRIGYAGQNGRPYVGVGALMTKRGQVPPNQASMQGIMALLRAMPDGGKATMDEDGSYVFFREITGDGPIGALGVPVVGHVSVAADPRFVPLGAPIFLQMDRPEATGLWVAQDTGGAIKGANRVDTFWGAGAQARLTAGGMSARGRATLLLPSAAAARLLAGATGAPAQR